MTIRAENICRVHDGKTVLDRLSLEIEPGSFCALLGPANAGKTTLLRILAGIEAPDHGRVYCDGIDVTDMPVSRREIAFVYQQFVNYPSMTVYENIASPLRVSKAKHGEAEIDRKVRETAALLGLDRVLDHLPEHISGGQRQRCAIARALAKDARFMFLDEPLANLDFKLREELRSELKGIFRERDGVVVYATPEPIDALMMATHVAFLHQGTILQHGRVRDVFEHPSHAAVAAYCSFPPMNILDCSVERHEGRTTLKLTPQLVLDIGDRVDSIGAGRYLAGIRPHHIRLDPGTGRAIPLRATVDLAEVSGSNTELHLVHEGIKLTLLVQTVEHFEVGDSVTAFLDPDQMYLFDVKTERFVARTCRETV